MINPLKFGRHRGDTILEVMVAMALLSMILAGTFSILNNAIEANANVRNRIVALNVAREGFEAVRNLRDTNWLKYSGDRRGKWLCLDSPIVDTCGPTGSDTQMDDGTGSYYKIDYETSQNRYFLDGTAINVDLDLTSGLQAPNIVDYQLHLDGTNNRYTHTTSGVTTPTIFYRQIYLQTVNPFDEELSDPSFCDNPTQEPDCINARLRVRVGVHWLEQGRPQQVFLEGNLFDFFERKHYDPSV